MTDDYAEYLAFAHRLADAAADEIRPLFRTPLPATDKSHANEYYSPVTAADLASERAMRAMIEATYPEHGIMGEELGYDGTEAEFYWALDPIDGTRSFVVGYPTFGTLIGLNHRGTVKVGVMNQPITRERFAASPAGSFYGEQRMATRPCPNLDSAILAFSGPWLFRTAPEQDAVNEIADRTMLTMYTGDCYNYCLLALGRIDLVIEAGLYPHDIQALIPIIEGAGGVVTTWDGERPDMGGWIVAAGDARIHDLAVAILGPAMHASQRLSE